MRFVSEKQAIELLEGKGFQMNSGRICPPKDRMDGDVSVLESDAIDYLCQEYDYTFE